MECTPEPADAPGSASMRWWETLSLVGLGALLVAFGYLTLLRAAYYDNRMTDYGVYARAAWALRTNHDLYTTTDDNGWHYVYPPAFAVIFIPFADPPQDAENAGYLPYEIGVVVWYVISLLLVAYSCQTFAVVVLPNARRFSRRWWYARLIPFDVCISGIGYTLSRGQANILLVAIIAAAFAAAMRGKQIRSGFWFALAVALKIFPGLLLAFPLVRREWRSGFGVVLGCVFAGMLPAIVWGIPRAIDENIRFVERVVLPAVGGPTPPELAKELHNMTAKPSQSFMAILHYMQYPTTDNRPNEPDAATKRAHWILSFILIVGTLVVGFRMPRPMPADDALVFLGALIIAMLLVVPMSHMHYYAIIHPAAAGIWLRSMKRSPGAVCGDPYTLAGLLCWMILTTIPLLPGELCIYFRYQGMAMWPTLGLWIWSIGILIRARRSAIP